MRDQDGAEGAFELRLRRAEGGWSWALHPPEGAPVAGSAPSAAAARREAAFAAGLLQALRRVGGRL